MKLVVADTGALISLGHAGYIDIIEKIFGEFYIAQAVWEEMQSYEHPEFDPKILKGLKNKIVQIKSKNHLSIIMDYGESESVILYEELHADYLLIDDYKARLIAESYDINCIGSIGILIKAKQKGLISELRPTFQKWIATGRYFSFRLLNQILIDNKENPL